MTMTMTMMKTTTIYQLYWCNFIAICTTCRKKHSERLLGLGWHSSTKGQSTRKLQILRGLLDILLFLRYLTTQVVYSHATPYIEIACQVRNWDKDCAFLKYHLNQETGKKTWLNNWCPLYKNVNALLKCNTRTTVGTTVSMEPWQINDRAFTVNLLRSNVHRH